MKFSRPCSSAVGRESYDQLAFFPTLDLQPGIGLAKSKQPGLSVAGRAEREGPPGGPGCC